MPTCPFVFAICTHPLAAALKTAAQSGETTHLKVWEDQLLIQMFADDLLLFLEADNGILRKALQIV